MTVKVLGVAGSTRAGSRTKIMVELALAACRESGAETQLLDLSSTRLPLFESGAKELAETPEVKHIIQTALWADAFVLGSPEYHGGIGGALKNWFDYLYSELSGKVCGAVSASGGGGGTTSIIAIKQSFAWCHGFNLPFHAGARGSDFEDNTLASATVVERLERLGHDVVRYAATIRPVFEQARALGKEDRSAGFAGYHA